MIYDCIPFFNELDLLELRMEELGDVVDRFVIVEATVTHAGTPKPLLFAENRARFEPWASRIIHVVVNDMPPGPDPWARERYQRDAIARGLTAAQQGDAIIVSDADEIPSADAVRRWRQGHDARQFTQLFCYYWMNCVGGFWAGSRIVPFHQLHRFAGMSALRHTDLPSLDNGGWHFSFLGGADAIRAKLAAYAHQDLNTPRYNAEVYLAAVTSLGLDLFGRGGMDFDFRDVDHRFPAAVSRHPERYRRYLCDARFNEKWTAPDQLLRLADLCAGVTGLAGAAMEIGCWEGRSTIVLAHACYPNTLLAIDTWRGSVDEHPNHPSVAIAAARDVFHRFLLNVSALTRGNVEPVREDCLAFLRRWNKPLKFAYIDASHDYSSVKRTIEALRPWMVPGGVLCGDDILTANREREDLAGGVERAVRELLPGYETAHNLWWWRQV
jgi:beta-1,4-mannosyl-glycoprotein beta-1,4-N-acetylglucosaminyltransferase